MSSPSSRGIRLGSAHITMDAGSASSSAQLHGTIAQEAYDAPDHCRRSDRLMLTDSLTDITNAGLMSDPESGGGGGSPPVTVGKQFRGLIYS